MVFQVLMTAAPRVKYDLTMDYRYCDFGEVIDFLRKIPDIALSVFDGAVMNHLIKDYVERFLLNYDVVIFYAETAEARMTKQLAEMCKKISPKTKIVVYGDATLYIPKYFSRYPFDAVHVNGDHDLVLADYINFLQGRNNELHGLLVNTELGWKETQAGKLLAPESWGFPALDALPLEEYRAFSFLKGSKGLEGSVYVAKGCKYACPYCVLPRREGLVDRRRPIPPLLDYLESNKMVFSEYQLHAGTFTEDKDWVLNFCSQVNKRGININWKCTTRVDSLDEQLIEKMASAGCKSINIGVESLLFQASSPYNKADLLALQNLSLWLQKSKVQSTAFVMIGTADQEQSDVDFTINQLESMSYKVRPTAYTPFHKLSSFSVEELDNMNLENWDRKSLWSENSKIEYREFHRLLLRSYEAR